jgi:hypothetical protein
MHNQKLRKLGAVVLMAVVVGAMTYVSQTSASKLEAAQTEQSNAPLTPWGEPDLQGIWSVELLVPLERPNGVTTEFYTEEQVAELDRERAEGSVFGNHVRAERGSEADVAGAYNAVFTSQRPTGRRTGMVIDPPDGKVPPLTPEARARQTELFEYQAALLQNTVVCRDGLDGCIGGTYGPRSPLRDQQPPYYSTRNINRANGPEDRSLGERCMSGNLPNFRGGFTGIHYRIVQSPGAVTIFYDVGQGQGFNRVIPITDAPHLPAHVRQWWGDSRGRWEGDTLVVDVTNFSGKTEFRGARENLRLIERWRRTGPETLEVVSTLEDSTVWTRPWTVIQDFAKQPEAPNRIYYEPRCHEGNYGLPGLLVGSRAEDEAFAEGRGRDPGTRCIAGCASPEGRDPLALR